MEQGLEEQAKDLRRELRAIGDQVKALMNHGDLENAPRGAEVSDTNEAKANIMLAYRYTENAVMRLGKVVQAMDGGVSVYQR